MEQPHKSNENVDETGDSPEPSGESVNEFEHTHAEVEEATDGKDETFEGEVVGDLLQP